MNELKVYEVDGYTFQFREGEQPESAVPVGEEAPKQAPKRTAKAKRAEEE